MTEAAAGRAPHSSAAEAGRCAVNEAGLWEGKGQAQALACVLQDEAVALLLLWAPRLMPGRQSLLGCLCGCAGHRLGAGALLHTQALWINPLCATQTGCPRETMCLGQL